MLTLALLAAATSPTHIDDWTFQQVGSTCIARSEPDQSGTTITLTTMAHRPEDLDVLLTNPSWSNTGKEFVDLSVRFVSLPKLSSDGRTFSKAEAPDSIEVKALTNFDAQPPDVPLLMIEFDRQFLKGFTDMSKNGVRFAFFYQDQIITDYYILKPFVQNYLDRCRDPFAAAQK